MTEQYSLDLDEAQFAKMLFDHVREMSKDVAGVTRQGYGPLETQELEYLKGSGGKLDLDIQTDLAGNVWRPCREQIEPFPPSCPEVMPTAYRRAVITTVLPALSQRSAPPIGCAAIITRLSATSPS